MDSRVILVGMNNPQGNPAFWPHPPGCAGHRLYMMLKSGVPNLTTTQFRESFDFINVLPDRVWTDIAARRAGPPLRNSLRGRRLVLVGVEVRDCMRFPNRDFLVWAKDFDVEWACFPHPSGRNRYFNDPPRKEKAVRFLHNIYLDARAHGLQTKAG